MASETRGLNFTFERKHERLLSRRQFAKRMAVALAFAAVILTCALALGTFGYHWIARFEWIDAFLNAAMILTGMGPIHIPETTGGKLFAIFYALFSGLVFLTAAGFLIAPFARRTIHDLHLKIHVPDAPDDRPAKPPLP
jgi:hypothetical protein